jgi:hypothetical protein
MRALLLNSSVILVKKGWVENLVALSFSKFYPEVALANTQELQRLESYVSQNFA